MAAISSDGRGSERVPSTVITTAARDLFPGCFAMVMATGAASVAANLLGMRAVAVSLLAVNVVVLATLWSLTLMPEYRMGCPPGVTVHDLGRSLRRYSSRALLGNIKCMKLTVRGGSGYAVGAGASVTGRRDGDRRGPQLLH